MRLRDLGHVADFPAVLSGADIAAHLQNPDTDAAREFLGGYLGLDSHSRHALHTALSSLAQREVGGAFWLNGVFGSGKSHFLGVVALLGQGSGGETFAATHPDCAPYLQNFARRLCLHISLDEFDASQLGLEAVFWRQLEALWARRELGEFPIERDGARVEAFASLETALQNAGLSGLVVCFDELSLFLGGRDHKPLQADAAFLQFLGAHSRRAPLWVFAALQKTIDDISGLERYSLSQIRDRFTLLPLSLSNISALVQMRLVQVSDEEAVQKVCNDSFARLSQRLPRLAFGAREWRASWPFHPATLGLLEAVTGRFFSRTRSATLFCARSIDLDKSADFRVAPEAIWDYFEPELEAHPDLRPLLAVWRAWEDAADAIFDEKDRENGRRAGKFLLLCKIAGQSPTPIQLANDLGFDLDLAGDGAYEYARFLLERLRLRGAFVALERGETPLAGRYTVDLGRRVGEMARRHLAATLETLPSADARIASHVVGCCRGDLLPLGELAAPRSFSLFWHSAPRRLSVEMWNGSAPQGLANRAAATRELGAPDDALLAIWPPFNIEEADFEAIFGQLEPDARPALWIWKPRSPARDEWELAREATAASLATLDPVLRDNRRGRALLEHLEKEAPARETQLQRVALRLLLEGELVLGGGAVLEASELTRGEGFAALLEAVGDFAWPHLFPRFVEVAPRARLLSPSNADTLCLEILRRAPAEPFFAPSLERLANHVARPLGAAASHAGRWKIAAGNAELTGEMRAFLGEGATYAALEAHFSKSLWGLRGEQTAILTCTLLRSGEIAAFDERGSELSPPQIGLPLRRAVHFLRPGRLPDAPQWARIATLARELCGFSLGAASFAEAQRAATALLEWREETAQKAELALARAAQLRRALGHDAHAWPRFERAQRALGAVLEAVPARGAAFEVLSRAASLDFELVREDLSLWHHFESALGQRLAPLLGLNALLGHPEFAPPPELSDARGDLLKRLGAGEDALFDPDLPAEAEKFRADYAAHYALWHGAQNDAARWNGWRALAQSDEIHVLERLASLQNRTFGGALRGEIERELAKRCARDGALAAGEAACSSCGLRLGERLIMVDPRRVAEALEGEMTMLHRAVQDTAPRTFLGRHHSPLAEWNGEAGALFPLLSSANLRLLDDALAPRRRASRSGEKLLEMLKEGGTRVEIEAAFARWLDGGEGLGADDEIEIVD